MKRFVAGLTLMSAIAVCRSADIEGAPASQLSGQVKNTISGIADRAGLSKVTVTSSDRSPGSHAHIIVVDKLRCSGRDCPGKQQVLDDYCAIHDVAINELFADTSWTTADQAVDVLADRLTAVLPATRDCVMHVIVPGQNTTWKAVDIAPSSIPPEKRCDFLREAQADERVASDRIFVPASTNCSDGTKKASETAFHIEIRQ
ncbi:MAG: hypothetical protein IPG63_07635 [Xanthomonadales bacterium]|nr:hypothetical protein [Xanthomonadales bacterium]MBK7146881.1 hypothetical protein [Xanthomonadales bacterium]